MTWLIQFLIAWFSNPQNLNLTFALVCIASAMQAEARGVMWLSAALYVLLALV